MDVDQQQQWIRKGNVVVFSGEQGTDLSQLRFTFSVTQNDAESPNSCAIRIYNLSRDTVKKIRREYSRVVLQAGYENAQYGVIFEGTIKQFRIGRESATDSYLDILAADGDVGYNFGICNRTLAAGCTPQQVIEEAAKAMGLDVAYLPKTAGGTIPNPRGKVLFGMARDIIRNAAQTIGSTWSIQGGKVQVIPLTGYLPGEAVVLNWLTGMIGVPEQTADGIKVRCLLNPKLRIGGLVKIDNRSVNQVMAQNNFKLPFGQLRYDKYAGIEAPADVSADGLYRLYVVEHTGDSRGQAWYSDLICLAVDPTSDTVMAYG